MLSKEQSHISNTDCRTSQSLGGRVLLYNHIFQQSYMTVVTCVSGTRWWEKSRRVDNVPWAQSDLM
eukprot:8659878-Prorocentrum_lima.AAC.1